MSSLTDEIGERIHRDGIRWVRTDAVTLDGLVIGKHLSATKFLGSLPTGHAISEIAHGMDLGGTPYLAWWNDWRPDALGDIVMRPDLDTFAVLPDRPNTATVLCDNVELSGDPLPLCSRSLLRRLVDELAGRGLRARAAFEVEAMVFAESPSAARRLGWRGLTPMSLPAALGYLHQNTRHQYRYLDEVLRRLEAIGVPIEGFHDEAAPGQIELNLDPADPVAAADHVVRIKQTMRDVAADQGCVVTFMAKPSAEYGNGLHVHHSLTRDGSAVFHAVDGILGDEARRWLGGVVATLPAATSLHCPNINSFRRMVGFSAAPTVASWGHDDKSAAVRVLSRSALAARIECRVAGGDANPYLVLAAVLAGGLAGLDHHIDLPPPIGVASWGLPPTGWPHLPTTITSAAEALEADGRLRAALGEPFVEQWIKTRRWEWLMYHTTGGDASAVATTGWELTRYFEVV